MLHAQRRLSSLTMAVAALASLIIGCQGATHDKYVTETTDARGALEAGLAAWASGEPHQTVKSFTTPVDVYDARWRKGDKLERFEIVEELPGDPHPSFRVKVHFSGKDQEEETTYLVMGIDPIMVYRSEDYHRERDAGM